MVGSFHVQRIQHSYLKGHIEQIWPPYGCLEGKYADQSPHNADQPRYSCTQTS